MSDCDAPELKRCPVCKGRGYFHCTCWPGDCICGEDYQDCENCHGEGWIEGWIEEWDDDPAPPSPDTEGERRCGC